jgi:PAS domain S-box-containing protein
MRGERTRVSLPERSEGGPERVVAIGASAGGLKAFSQLFERLPGHTGLAFILVQHLQPTHPTLLPSLLSRHTPMAIIEAEDGMVIEPDHVYVHPHNANLTIEEGVLRLSPRIENDTPYHPIDGFMRSLAEAKRSNAIGVILSGTGTDGTIGLQAIKAQGGISFAQNKDSAEYYDMAHNAVRAGCVDFEFTPVRIAEELERFGEYSDVTVEAQRRVSPGVSDSFNEILQLLRETTGIDPLDYKPDVIQGCISRRMNLQHLDGLDAYAAFLRAHREEADSFYQDLYSGMTGFFRNPETFEALKENAFRDIVQRRRSDKPLRVWIPGCVTGEDAYSTAIAFVEFAENSAEHIPIEIFVTDPNLKMIERARSGIYPQSIAFVVSMERLARFFVKRGDGYQINRSIRGLCIFARHNLVTDPPLSRMDLVVFRHRLNDLAPASCEKMIRNLHYSLKPAGLLLVESEETARLFRCLFKVQDSAHNIYLKTSVPRIETLTSLSAFVATDRAEGQELEEGQEVEELRTSIEKLACLHEELEITHEELMVRNIELTDSNETTLLVNADLENLLSSIEIPIVMVDQRYLIRRFTPMARLLLNLTDASVGRPITDLNLPVDPSDLMQMLDEAVSTFHSAEREVQDRNGRWYSLRVQPYKTLKDRVEGAVVTMIDVTDRKRTEDELRAAYEHAEAATRAKDEFLSVVSHELRTPLVSIMGYTQLLDVSTVDAALIRRIVTVVEKNSKIQLQLIEDLLDTARMMSGKLRLELQPLDLAGVINAALEVVRPAAQAKGIELHSTLDPLGAQITGDPDRLQQTVWNLVSNAIKFTPKGGRVDVSLSRTDPHVEIVVCDTGKGIDPELLLHVFERFRQGDMSSTRRSGGLGLGLALVKHLVELHGGTVEAASAGLNKGATFKVRIPVRAVYAASPPERENHKGLRRADLLAGVDVLVVDDEEDVRNLLTLTLETFGAKVQAVSSGKEAVELLTGQTPNQQFDVLICDIAMPDEDGYTVLRNVRVLPPEKGGDIPAIALTAHGRSEYRVRALEAGFQTYVVKPVKPDELVGIIQSIIKQLG